jgi:hypothetical protein
VRRETYAPQRYRSAPYSGYGGTVVGALILVLAAFHAQAKAGE